MDKVISKIKETITELTPLREVGRQKTTITMMF